MLCALADSLVPVIIGRGLQGMGMGIVALGISALRDLMPPERLGSSIALISSSLGIGGALGLPFAAAVAEHADWRVLFWISAALSALVGVLWCHNWHRVSTPDAAEVWTAACCMVPWESARFPA